MFEFAKSIKDVPACVGLGRGDIVNLWTLFRINWQSKYVSMLSHRGPRWLSITVWSGIKYKLRIKKPWTTRMRNTPGCCFPRVFKFASLSRRALGVVKDDTKNRLKAYLFLRITLLQFTHFAYISFCGFSRKPANFRFTTAASILLHRLYPPVIIGGPTVVNYSQ